MKITDDEREAAWEIQYLLQQVLIEQQRAKLYVDVYTQCLQRGVESLLAATRAQTAIMDMERAFAPVCDACRESDNAAAQQKAN